MIDLKDYVKDVPDFPIEGIVYKDIQPVLANPEALYEAILGLAELLPFDITTVDYFVGIESRGFIFASGLSLMFGTGFKMIRKEGKLPDTEEALHGVEYDLEYGTDRIEMQAGKGKIVLVDDVFATGGTMAAAQQLAQTAGYEVLDSICLLDVGIVKKHNTKCVLSY